MAPGKDIDDPDDAIEFNGGADVSQFQHVDYEAELTKEETMVSQGVDEYGDRFGNGMFEQKPRFVETFAGYVTDSSVEELKDTDHQHAQQDYMAEQELCDTAIEEFKNYHGRPSFSPKMKKYSGNIAIEAWRFFAGEMILFLKDNNAKKDIIAKWERLNHEQIKAIESFALKNNVLTKPLKELFAQLLTIQEKREKRKKEGA